MFAEEDLLPIAALQHLAFCERQWGLMYLENIWTDNRLTAEGLQLHAHADQSASAVQGEIRIAYSLRLRSLELGLTGVADVVEFHPLGLEDNPPPERPPNAVTLDGIAGRWMVFPVEYKHGKPKIDRCDEVQLCAQALCLEEMLAVYIDAGAIFYGEPRRRSQIRFDPELRSLTLRLTERLHELTSLGRTPAARYGKHCRSCSLVDSCMPRATDGRKKVGRYIDRMLADEPETEGTP